MVRANLDKVVFTKIVAELVKNYPTQSKEYLRPQTFANVRYREDIFKTSLDKTKIYETITDNQNIFFSRAWDNEGNGVNKIPFDFPLVFLLELEDLKSDHLRPTYKFLFGVMDLAERDKDVDVRVEEIKRNDLDLIARSILNELLTYVYADTDGSGIYDWKSCAYYQTLKDTGVITRYSQRQWMKTALKNQNDLTFKPFEEMDKRKRLNGVLCELHIQGDLTPIKYSY